MVLPAGHIFAWPCPCQNEPQAFEQTDRGDIFRVDDGNDAVDFQIINECTYEPAARFARIASAPEIWKDVISDRRDIARNRRLNPAHVHAAVLSANRVIEPRLCRVRGFAGGPKFIASFELLEGRGR